MMRINLITGVIGVAFVVLGAPSASAEKLTLAGPYSWVTRVGLAGPRRLPVYPVDVGRQRTASLFDHLVGSSKQ